ncbi:MAG: hypothetical protein E7409_07380 [Ruminococcaceae bacterium]|nr:hypothetical protein [Oscillospiraceae bacterium]
MNFLNANKRFSFRLGGVDAWSFPYTSETTQDGDTIITTYLFAGGLKITNIAKKYEKYHAYEWVSYIENTSDTPTDIISELWDCDCTLDIAYQKPFAIQSYFPREADVTKIYSPNGSTCSMTDFYADADSVVGNEHVFHLNPGEEKTYSASGGRSSEEKAPFFNIHKNGKGYIFAIGWTGQWLCKIARTENSVTFRSKVEDTHFRVMPGEKFRTSSVVIMAYDGDVAASQNKWRALVKEHFSLIGAPGRGEYAPFSAMIWGGMETKAVLDRIKKIKENNLPYEYVWMDAGWYGANTAPTPDEFEGDWGSYTGDWVPSPLIHPNGLKDVSKAVHDAGMKFLLWFEPERVVDTTPIAQAHPEYFLVTPDDAAKDGLEHFFLLNLGDHDAWNYCFDTLANMIEQLQIDCYRQDFNMPPLGYWRKGDAPDRMGICEIKYINGMYNLWDALLEKFPALIIDNCSSGGKRIDVETLRRSVPLWRSDYQCLAGHYIEGSQVHSITYGAWMPFSGMGTGRIQNEYRIRSSYAPALQMAYSYSQKEEFCATEKEISFIQKYAAEYLRIRPYFSEDFYPLTKISDKDDTWCVMQYDRPSQNDGLLQVFRREQSPYETATFFLRAMDEAKNYTFTDIDGGEFTISGKALAEEGLKLMLPQKGTAKIYLYKGVAV